jgi:hypothetical protein
MEDVAEETPTLPLIDYGPFNAIWISSIIGLVWVGV